MVSRRLFVEWLTRAHTRAHTHTHTLADWGEFGLDALCFEMSPEWDLIIT